jgi:hypothetical protein
MTVFVTLAYLVLQIPHRDPKEQLNPHQLQVLFPLKLTHLTTCAEKK